MVKKLTAEKKTDIYNPFTKKRERYIVKDYPGQPRCFNDINVLWTQMCAYVDYMEENKRPMQMAGLARWLGCSRSTLALYQSGQYDVDDVKYSDAIDIIRTIIESDKIEGGLLRTYDAGITKFDLVNNHGYSEKVIREHPDQGGGAIQPEDISDLDFCRRFLWMLHENTKNQSDGVKDGH